MAFAAELRLAVDIVRRCSEVAARVRRTMVATQKEDNTVVTVADFAVQAIALSQLRAAFPLDAVVAEESSAEFLRAPRALQDAVAAATGMEHSAVVAAIDPTVPYPHAATPAERATLRWWTLDPIDGTLGFVRTGGQYSVCLALLVGAEPRVAAVGCPALSPPDSGVVFSAVAGGGAFADGVPIHVSPPPPPGGEGRGFSTVVSVTAHDASGTDRACVAAAGGVVAAEVDSQVKYCMVARGDVAAYVRYCGARGVGREKVWDHAAGALLVTEAGGAVSDVGGAPLVFDSPPRLGRNSGVLATCGGHVHAALVAQFAAHGAATAPAAPAAM